MLESKDQIFLLNRNIEELNLTIQKQDMLIESLKKSQSKYEAMTEELKTMRELKIEHQELKEAYAVIEQKISELD